MFPIITTIKALDDKFYSVFMYILIFLSQFFSFFSLATLSLLQVFFIVPLFFSFSVIDFLLFTELWSCGPKCVTLAGWHPLLPNPNRSLLRTVFTGYFLPTPAGPKPVINRILKKNWDQYQYLGNCPPTPPLTQQQSIDNKLGLMLG